MNKNIKVDSPEYNKKSKMIFIIILIASFAIGGFGGFFGAAITNFFEDDLSNVGKLINEKLPFFQTYIMPFVLLVFTVICFIFGEVWIKKAKKQIATWDGEDDDHIAEADKILSRVLNVSSILMISIQFLFGLATYQLLSIIRTTGNPYMTLFMIAVYFSGMFISLSQQNRTVNAVKKYAPEKQGSVYDMKFQKVWYNSCDEAERQIIGDASRDTIRFMNSVFSIFLTVTIIVAMFIPIGLLCTFFIGVLWLIMSCYYSHTCMKLEHGKK